jgi:hypothetical protein
LKVKKKAMSMDSLVSQKRVCLHKNSIKVDSMGLKYGELYIFSEVMGEYGTTFVD